MYTLSRINWIIKGIIRSNTKRGGAKSWTIVVVIGKQWLKKEDRIAWMLREDCIKGDFSSKVKFESGEFLGI